MKIGEKKAILTGKAGYTRGLIEQTLFFSIEDLNT